MLGVRAGDIGYGVKAAAVASTLRGAMTADAVSHVGWGSGLVRADIDGGHWMLSSIALLTQVDVPAAHHYHP